MKLTVKILNGEYWWGGSSAVIDALPIHVGSRYALDMYDGHNQTMPLYLSSQGRYIWSERPMRVSVADGRDFVLAAERDDLIGGGEWSNNYKSGFRCDEELFVRMAQCSALFPMMQFSWAPWRILGENMQKLCLDAAKLHLQYANYITDLVKECAVSGEPIVRHMEYEYPHSGYEKIFDQFMLGSNILVAPVIEKGQTVREVVLPVGKWRYLDRDVTEGGRKVTVSAPIDILPYFVKGV